MNNLDLSLLRVLVVDDHAVARDMIRFVLHSLGIHMIWAAESGARGLEILEAEKPDLAIVDWQMAPMSGLDFARRVRGDKGRALRFTPIIMVTAYADARRVQIARDAGINEFVAKPFTARTLYCRIESLVERPRPFIEMSTYFGPDRRRHALAVTHERRAHTHAHAAMPSLEDMVAG